MEQLFPCPSFLRVLVVEAPKAAEAARFYKNGIFARVMTHMTVLAYKDGQQIPHLCVQLYTSEEHFIVDDLIDDPSVPGDRVMFVPTMENPNVAVTVARIVVLGNFYTHPMRALSPPTVDLLVQAAMEAGAAAEDEIVESEVSYGRNHVVTLSKRMGRVRDPFGFLLQITWYEPSW